MGNRGKANPASRQWRSEDVARKYDDYSGTQTQFVKSNRALIDFAGIGQGMKVLDLACGTGMTTLELLRRFASDIQIIAVDQSDQMIEQAQQKVGAPNVRFIRTPAEATDQVLNEMVDCVVCNAAFWQMDMNAAARAVSSVLKEGGLFVFNIPDQFFEFGLRHGEAQDYEKVMFTMRKLMRSIASERYGFDGAPMTGRSSPLNIDDLNEILRPRSFEIVRERAIDIGWSPGELREFLEIPNMTAWWLPGVEYDTRMQVLDDAYQRWSMPDYMAAYWIFVAARKSIS